MALTDPLTILGMVGMLTFAVTAYFNYRIFQRLKEEGDTTLEYLFLRKEIRIGLQLLIGSLILFLISSLTTVIAYEIGMEKLEPAIRVGSAFLFIGYTSFFILLEKYTRPQAIKEKD